MMENGEFKVKGRVLSNTDINQIIEMVELYPRLSRLELVNTICVNLRWSSKAGKSSKKPIEDLLLEMETRGMINLPAKRKTSSSINSNKKKDMNKNTKKKGPRKRYTIKITEKTNPKEEITGIINDFMPVRLKLVSDVEEEFLWDEYVERYHILKYGSPFGDRLKYFIWG